MFFPVSEIVRDKHLLFVSRHLFHANSEIIFRVASYRHEVEMDPPPPLPLDFTIFLIEELVRSCLAVFHCTLSSPVLNEKATDMSEWQDASNYSLELWHPFRAS